MSEQSHITNSKDNYNVLPVDEISPSRRGDLEASDVEMDGVGEQILSQNLEQYSPLIDAAHDFVKNQLGMVDVSDQSRVAVLSPKIAEQWGAESQGGSYMPEIDVAVVFESTDTRPKTAKIAMASGLVHEIAHSGSVSTENADLEHTFWHEAIAGLAEYFALDNLSSAGEFTQPPDCIVKRDIDGREVSVVVPGSFRRVDASEVIEGKADTTQALIAAMVVGIGLKINGKLASETLASTRKGDDTAYLQLREAVDAIEPGFADFIDAQPKSSTEDILKIAQRAQQITGMDRSAA